MKNYYILDGKLLKERDITLAGLKRGFLYGDGVFETLHPENYHVFRWDDHWERLMKGLEVCGLEIKENSGRLKDRIETALKRYRIADAYVRVSVFRRATDSFDPGTERRTMVLVLMKKHHPYPSILYEKGIRCAISGKFFRNEKSPLVYIKSLNYLENLLARLDAGRNGCEESILLNTRGFLASASVSNLFFVKGKTIFTPSIDCGILSGITRKAVLEICKTQGINVREGMFPPEKLRSADEVFLTNTLMGVMPVRKVKGFFKARKFLFAGMLRKELKKLTG